jgi:hypothetical protein
MGFVLQNYKIYALTLLVILLGACAKAPGEGGTAQIVGEVWAERYNFAGELVASYPKPEARVYIVYGDNEIYDDDTRTDYEGRYSFTYLHKGDYVVYAYSECDTCAAGTQAVFQTVSITENNELLNVPRIVVLD